MAFSVFLLSFFFLLSSSQGNGQHYRRFYLGTALELYCSDTLFASASNQMPSRAATARRGERGSGWWSFSMESREGEIGFWCFSISISFFILKLGDIIKGNRIYFTSVWLRGSLKIQGWKLWYLCVGTSSLSSGTLYICPHKWNYWPRGINKLSLNNLSQSIRFCSINNELKKHTRWSWRLAAQVFFFFEYILPIFLSFFVIFLDHAVL